jgi:taurine dioxygenase
MPLTDVRPLEPGLPFGVRIGGLTRAALEDQATREEIAALFEREGMIVFERVEPSPAMQLAISNVFGPLKEHPVASVTRVDADGMPGVVEIRNPPNSGGVVELAGKQLSHWLPWHYDHCYNHELNRAGVLRAVTITDEGGVTGFADGIALYDAFPPELLRQVEGKEVIYTLDVQYDTMRFGRPDNFRVLRRKPVGPGFDEQARAMPRAIHPAVWTRADGRKVLHISPWMAEGFLGAEDEAGYALFEEVCQTINRLAAQCSYHHHWRTDDMVIWDNWRMLHAVSGNPPEEERTMHRTTIKGDYGLGRFENDGIGGKVLETTV